MRAIPALSSLQEKILEALVQRHFATPGQLQTLCAAQKWDISRSVDALHSLELVDVHSMVRPHICCLTNRGAAVLNSALPSGGRRPSWSVMAHACHRNAFEIAMREKHSRFRFFPRLALLKQRLNPAHGDHAALIDDTSTTWYVLLDDYLMPPKRLTHRWTREHRPSVRHAQPGPRRRWRDVANAFVVVCTDEKHAARHRAVIARDRLPAEVYELEAIW